MLYGGKHEDNLNRLRYRKFCEKTAVKTIQLQSEVLPPTSVAAKYHSFRVYLQIQQWNGSNTTRLTDWGWEMSGGHLLSVLTDQQAAPDGLLRVVHCGCNGNCSNVRCTCRKTIWNVHLPTPSGVEPHAAIVLLLSLKVMMFR